MVREHMVPLTRGGHAGPENCVCACTRCNGQKGAFTVDEYRLWRALRVRNLNFHFAGEAPAPPRDWIACHSQDFQRGLMIHNMPGAAEAFALSNGWARKLSPVNP
jgi:hypothetical protein